MAHARHQLAKVGSCLGGKLIASVPEIMSAP